MQELEITHGRFTENGSIGEKKPECDSDTAHLAHVEGKSLSNTLAWSAAKREVKVALREPLSSDECAPPVRVERKALVPVLRVPLCDPVCEPDGRVLAWRQK